MAYRRVLAAVELPPREPTPAEVDGVPLCLVRLDDHIAAFVDRCPHRGSALSEGRLDGTVLTCATHSWQFDVRTGELEHLRAPDRLDLRTARERDGDIEVDT